MGIYLSSVIYPAADGDVRSPTSDVATRVPGMDNLKEGEFVASLDCGTTSVRFIIFDARAIIVAQHQLEFPQYYPHPGWHEHEPDEIQQVSEECMARACDELERNGWMRSSIKAIGITNQRETAVAWDRTTGRPLCRAIVWDDARTKSTVAHFQYKLRIDGIEVAPGDIRKGDAGVAALRELTGLPLSTYFSAIKLCWMLENHEIVRAAHEADNLCFGTVESWLVYNFTGGPVTGLHITEPTNASRTLLLDIHSLQWSPALLRFFSLRASILPRLVSSSEVYGTISAGPLAGVRIAGLVGDQQGALVGNKCFREGEAKCTYGTGAFLLFNTGEKAVASEHGLLTTVAYQPGPGKKPVYALEGSIAAAGSAINWLRDGLGVIHSSSEVNALAAQEPTTGGVYFVTAFSGLLAPYWDPGAAGTLIGLTKYTNMAHIARAAIEAIAFQTRAVIESMLKDVSKDEVKQKSRSRESSPCGVTGGSKFETSSSVDSSAHASASNERLLPSFHDRVTHPTSELHPTSGDKEDFSASNGLTSLPSPEVVPQPASLSAVIPDPDPSSSHADEVREDSAVKDTHSAKVEFTHLKVDGGVTNGDLCMQVLADIGGFSVVRPVMRESTALGSALLAGAAVGLFGWDLKKAAETMKDVNTEGVSVFEPERTVEEREVHWKGWKRAVERSLGWDEAPEE